MNRYKSVTQRLIASSPSKNEEHDIMTVDEAAKYLKVCTKTIRTLIARGDLHATKVGRQYRLSRQALKFNFGDFKSTRAGSGE